MSAISFEEDIEESKTYGKRVSRLHILVDGKEVCWFGRNDLESMQGKSDEQLENEVKRLFSGMKITEDERGAMVQEVVAKIKSCKV